MARDKCAKVKVRDECLNFQQISVYPPLLARPMTSFLAASPTPGSPATFSSAIFFLRPIKFNGQGQNKCANVTRFNGSSPLRVHASYFGPTRLIWTFPLTAIQHLLATPPLPGGHRRGITTIYTPTQRAQQTMHFDFPPFISHSALCSQWVYRGSNGSRPSFFRRRCPVPPLTSTAFSGFLLSSTHFPACWLDDSLACTHVHWSTAR